MATRIFCVDVSGSDTDFQALATEPGLAMLDRQNANYVILRRWLGNLIAEPSYRGGDLVDFYVQAEDGGRLENVECVSATKDDLEGPLNQELKTIQAKIKRARPEDASEQSLHRIVRKTINDLTKNLEQSDYDCYFFKYRVGKSPWKLVWCWGYQRSDPEPATSLICTNPECEQLFVRRPNQKPKCRGCAATVVRRRRGPLGFVLSGRNLGIAAALLLLLLLGIGYLGWPRVTVSPENWTGNMGDETKFKIERYAWFNTEDLTENVKAEVKDNEVMEFDGASGTALYPGKTTVTFSIGGSSVAADLNVKQPPAPNSLVFEPENVSVMQDRSTDVRVFGLYDKKKLDLTRLLAKEGFAIADTRLATMSGNRVSGIEQGITQLKADYKSVKAATQLKVLDRRFRLPDSLTVEPSTVDLFVGATQRLKVTADFGGGHVLDVTGDVAAWEVEDVNVAGSLGDGVLKGTTPGSTNLRVVYRTPNNPDVYTTADAMLKVAHADYKQLKITASPPTISKGQSSDLTVAGITEDGKEYRLAASAVRLSVDPPETGQIYGNRFIGSEIGTAKIMASVAGVSSELDVEVTALAPGTFVVKPDRETMLVYELLRLSILSADNAPIEVVSQDPKIVEVVGERNIVGTGVGTTDILVTQGDQKATVRITVLDSHLRGLQIQPHPITIRAGDTADVQTYGVFDVAGEIRKKEIDPRILRWSQIPLFEYVQFDRAALRLAGVSPTPEPQVLAMGLNLDTAEAVGSDLTAATTVTVIKGVGAAELTIAELLRQGFDGKYIPYPPLDLSGLGWGGGQWRMVDGGIRADGIRRDSDLYRYLPLLGDGAVIRGINDVDFSGMTPAEIEAWLKKNGSLTDGMTIRYLDGDGIEQSFVYRLPRTDDSVEVYVERPSAEDVVEDGIRIGLQVFVEKAGKYRILREATDAEKAADPARTHVAISDSFVCAPETVSKMTANTIVPFGASDRYLIVIERTTADGEVELFPQKVTIRRSAGAGN